MEQRVSSPGARRQSWSAHNCNRAIHHAPKEPRLIPAEVERDQLGGLLFLGLIHCLGEAAPFDMVDAPVPARECQELVECRHAPFPAPGRADDKVGAGRSGRRTEGVFDPSEDVQGPYLNPKYLETRHESKLKRVSAKGFYRKAFSRSFPHTQRWAPLALSDTAQRLQLRVRRGLTIIPRCEQ